MPLKMGGDGGENKWTSGKISWVPMVPRAAVFGNQLPHSHVYIGLFEQHCCLVLLGLPPHFHPLLYNFSFHLSYQFYLDGMMVCFPSLTLFYWLKLCGCCIYRLWPWNNGKPVGWHLWGLWHVFFPLALFIFCANVMTTTRHILHYSQPAFLPTSKSLHIWVSSHQLLLLLCCLISIILLYFLVLIHQFIALTLPIFIILWLNIA